MPTQGLGGFGHVDAQMPMPVGGGAPAANPLGALLMALMKRGSMGGQPSAPTDPTKDPQTAALMARMFGLGGGQQQAQARPLESWIGPR